MLSVEVYSRSMMFVIRHIDKLNWVIWRQGLCCFLPRQWRGQFWKVTLAELGDDTLGRLGSTLKIVLWLTRHINRPTRPWFTIKTSLKVQSKMVTKYNYTFGMNWSMSMTPEQDGNWIILYLSLSLPPSHITTSLCNFHARKRRRLELKVLKRKSRWMAVWPDLAKFRHLGQI